MVVSVKERRGDTAFYEGQGDERKRTTDEVSKATSQMIPKPGSGKYSGTKIQEAPVYCLSGIRYEGGMNLT